MIRHPSDVRLNDTARIERFGQLTCLMRDFCESLELKKSGAYSSSGVIMM